jgi:glycosyltransferase involved in cell wall biosynthesis
VIVPIYNQSRYVRACLDSIWFQDYPGPIEIVVVNDGSTDDTAAVLAAFAADVATARTSFASRYDETEDVIARTHHDRYPSAGRSLRIVAHERNRGLAPALNTGFKACAGEYCTYVPSDDRCAPHMFATLAAALDAGCDFRLFGHAHRGRGGRGGAPLLPAGLLLPVQLRGLVPVRGVQALPPVPARTASAGTTRTLLAHDHELFLRFAEGGARLVHLPQALMYVLSHDGARNVDIHAPSNWNRLLEESKVLTLRARRALVEAAGQGGRCERPAKGVGLHPPGEPGRGAVLDVGHALSARPAAFCYYTR